MNPSNDAGTADAPLNKAQKAAAILIAMGKPVAGKLLKYFSQSELQFIISNAQTLRTIPAAELEALVGEFEDLFTEGAGLMDNARMMEDILQEGLTADEVEGLLGRRAPVRAQEVSIWDRLQQAEPAVVGNFLSKEHPQTVAYIVSMLPSSFAARTLLQLPEERRGDVIHRTLNMRDVNPGIAEIIRKRVTDLVESFDQDGGGGGQTKVVDMMNELDKSEVDALLGALDTISSKDAEKLRPKLFLFEDLLEMPAESRVALFDGVSGEQITMALKGADPALCEAVLSSIGARQRRMIETDLGSSGANPQQVATARRAIAQQAIRLADSGRIVLREQRRTQEAA